MSKLKSNQITKEHMNEGVQREKPYVYNMGTEGIKIQQYNRNGAISSKGYTMRSGRGETPQQYDEKVRSTYATK